MCPFEHENTKMQWQGILVCVKFYCESVCVCTVYGGRCRPASELALCVVLVLKALLPNLSLSLPPCLFLSFLFFPLAVCRKLGVKCLQLKQWQVCSAVRHRVIYLQSTLHFIYHWHTHTNTFYNSVHCFPALSPGDNERVRLPQLPMALVQKKRHSTKRLSTKLKPTLRIQEERGSKVWRTAVLYIFKVSDFMILCLNTSLCYCVFKKKQTNYN